MKARAQVSDQQAEERKSTECRQRAPPVARRTRRPGARLSLEEIARRLAFSDARAFRALDELRGWSRAALLDEALVQQNRRSSQIRFWSAWLRDDLHASESTARNLGEIAVGVLCMPDFQVNALAGDAPSSTLVVLGDGDGGLYGVITEKVPWFEAWLIDGLARRVERFGFGRNMFRVTDGELNTLAGALELDAFLGEHGRTTLARLRVLLTTVGGNPELELVVHESG